MDKTYEANMMWLAYKKLENELIDLTYQIHFNDEKYKIASDSQNEVFTSQISTFSNEIADIIISCNVQIESMFRILYKKNTGKENGEIGKMIRHIEKLYTLEKKQIKIVSKHMNFKQEFAKYFAPMSYKTKDANDYYSVYCSLKHNRVDTLHKANLNILLRSTAALFILNVYNMYSIEEHDAIENFDQTQGSRIFVLKYGVDCCNSEDIIVIEENKDYSSKINSWTDNIPNGTIIDCMEYVAKNYRPHRYISRLCISEDQTKMRTIKYDKLIRDKIPEIIEKSGKPAVVEVMDDKLYLVKLADKLDEELKEFLVEFEARKNDLAIKELADIQEVILALVKELGINREEFEKIRLEKVAKNGAFEKKLLLKEVRE